MTSRDIRRLFLESAPIRGERIPTEPWPERARWLYWLVCRYGKKRIETCDQAPVSFESWKRMGSPGEDPRPMRNPRKRKIRVR